MSYLDIPFRIWIKQENGKLSIIKCDDRMQAITKIGLYKRLGIEAGFYYRQPLKKNWKSKKKDPDFKLQGLQGGQ